MAGKLRLQHCTHYRLTSRSRRFRKYVHAFLGISPPPVLHLSQSVQLPGTPHNFRFPKVNVGKIRGAISVEGIRAVSHFSNLEEREDDDDGNKNHG